MAEDLLREKSRLIRIQALLIARAYFALFGRRGATLSIDPTRQAQDLEQLARWKREGTIRVVIDRSFSLEATRDAMALAERGGRGKIILTTARV